VASVRGQLRFELPLHCIREGGATSIASTLKGREEALAACIPRRLHFPAKVGGPSCQCGEAPTTLIKCAWPE
jgi:hypothetical protein